MNPVDIAVIILYLCLVFALGLYFSRRQASTDTYFLAGRAVPGWVVGFSIMGTIIGSSTFVGQPGEVFRENMWALPLHLMLVPVMLFVAKHIVVFYRRVIRMSIYGYLEQRFGYPIRVYGGLAFIFSRLVDVSATFYFLSLAVAYLTGVDLTFIIVTIGVFTVAYTLLGGITAVLWTDVIQGIMLLGGGFIILLHALLGPEAGAMSVISTAIDGGKFSWGNLHFSVITDNLWIHLAIGAVWATQRFATDQHMVQRYLVARSDKEAQRAAYIGGVACLPVWMLFWIIGAFVWAYYQLGADVIPADVISNKSNIIPYFVKSQLPVGVIGLITASLIAAAMSSLDSDLNSIATVVVEDYYQRLRPRSTDRQQLLVGRAIVLILGCVAILFAMVWLGVESAITFMFELISIAAAGVLGLFILALFFRGVNLKGALTGVALCVLFTAWATLTSVELPVFGRTVLDLGDFNYTWNNKLIGVIGNMIMIVTGLMASRIFGGAQQDKTHLTLWANKEMN